MNVLMPLPLTDFDPSEAAVTWKVLSDSGIQVTFATPNGMPAACDDRMLRGTGLGPWKPILMADKNARSAYQKMCASLSFLKPITWDEANVDFDALVLAGGHAPGMKDYLESKVLQNLVSNYFARQKLIAAICHGVVLAARSKNKNGQSVLNGRRTTALLKSQEMTAWAMTCLWLGSYYRTYPISVQEEVTNALASKSDFLSGPTPVFRDAPNNLKPGFCVEDGNYISARWPGDAHRFANAISKKLKNQLA